MKKTAFWIALVVLLAGIVISLQPQKGHISFSASRRLSVLAPIAPEGWEVEDTPLGPTETATGGVVQALDCDDYIYKTYQKGGMQIRLYSAYWNPGKMDPSMVASHVPDVCWVDAGATVLERDDYRRLPGIPDPARFRIFEFPHNREEVAFWYCQGGKPVMAVDEAKAPVGGRLGRFTQMLRLSDFGLRPQDQLILRISTNRTIDELVKSDLWPRLIESLRPSGIFSTPTR